MRLYSLETSTLLSCSVDEAWEFFSTPLNLDRMTPPDMSFEILTEIEGKKMYAGMIIHYRVRPLLNIPVRWTTEITHCEEGRYFVDEQRFGPFAFWHHQHHFKPVENGVLMTDIVHYNPGLGFLGRIANAVFLHKKLEGIFSYRSEVIDKVFGQPVKTSPRGQSLTHNQRA